MRKLGSVLVAAALAVAVPVAAQETASRKSGPVQLVPSAPPAAAARAALRSTAEPAKAAPTRGAAPPVQPLPKPTRAADAPSPRPASRPIETAARTPPPEAPAARTAARAPIEAPVAKPAAPEPAAARPQRPEPVPPIPPGRTLRVAVEGSYPPFSEILPDGKVRGFDIDIANALCAEMKAKCLLVQQNFDRIQDSLVNRQTDLVVASLSMTDERRGRYAFTKKYYQIPAKFVARAGARHSFDDASLRGARVGVLAGSVHANYLIDRFGGIVRVVPYPTLPDALAALGEDELDLVFGDALMLELDFLRGPAGEGFAFAGPDLVDPDWFGDGIGIAVRSDDKRLLDSLNKALAKLRADGTYQSIARRYFSFDIYGGEAAPRPRERRTAEVPPRPQRELPQLIDGPTGSRR